MGRLVKNKLTQKDGLAIIKWDFIDRTINTQYGLINYEDWCVRELINIREAHPNAYVAYKKIGKNKHCCVREK